MPQRVSRRDAFTLIELLCVIAIIGVLASLTFPSFQSVQKRGEAASCLGKMRQLAVAVNLYANDHDDSLPKIESDPANPIYQPADDAKPMLEVLGRYGMTAEALQCPSDLKLKNRAKTNGTSYMWNPAFDEEPKSALLMYGRRGTFTVPLKRAKIATDWDSMPPLPHFNTLYLDGSVRSRNGS